MMPPPTMMTSLPSAAVMPVSFRKAREGAAGAGNLRDEFSIGLDVGRLWGGIRCRRACLLQRLESSRANLLRRLESGSAIHQRERSCGLLSGGGDRRFNGDGQGFHGRLAAKAADL